jgi:hypothetical protein
MIASAASAITTYAFVMGSGLPSPMTIDAGRRRNLRCPEPLIGTVQALYTWDWIDVPWFVASATVTD